MDFDAQAQGTMCSGVLIEFGTMRCRSTLNLLHQFRDWRARVEKTNRTQTNYAVIACCPHGTPSLQQRLAQEAEKT